MSTIAKSPSTIVLHEESDGEARIQMKDGDDFFIAIADAARACRAADKLRDFGDQIRELLDALKRWSDANTDNISAAYLVSRDRDVLFLVIQSSETFDSELTDRLTDLDIQIANDARLSLIRLEVMAIPAVSRSSANAFLASGPVFSYEE